MVAGEVAAVHNGPAVVIPVPSSWGLLPREWLVSPPSPTQYVQVSGGAGAARRPDFFGPVPNLNPSGYPGGYCYPTPLGTGDPRRVAR